MGDKRPWNRLDLTGQEYGRLTVLSPAGTIDGDATWRCRCESGNEVTVRTTSLRSGNTRSCGCLVREANRAREMDLAGRRFGRLTVLEPARNACGRAAWNCRCDCGNEVVVRTGDLTSGGTKSCGCVETAACRTAPEGT